MDLKAYIQIENLEDTMKANGIEVPRLRGLRLMRDETPYSEECIESNIKMEYNATVRSMMHTLSLMADALMEGDDRLYFARKSWLEIDERRLVESYDNAFREQAMMFNKYCGREDVMLIHSRMGGAKIDHWDDEKKEFVTDYDLEEQPWFLDYIHDADDGTYIDIYAKIDPTTAPKKEEEE